MANLRVLDGASNTKYIKTTGAGSDASPFVSHHIIDTLPVGSAVMASSTPVTIASDDTLVTALKTALELIDHLTAANAGNADANTQRVTIASDDANLAAIKAAVELIDNAISGNEMQVDIVASLPAGSNAIGKLAANSGVDIGDVDVTSVPAPLNITGGGVESSALRVTLANDSTGVVTVDDGGNSLTVDGAVAVSSGSVAVTNTVTETNSNAIKTAVELIDNAISGSEMQVDVVAAIPAGDNNIGNVDIVTLPSGNLGQQAMAASLSVVPANNITDATYIGDIKFGEGLPANSGVDIGDVTVNNAAGASAVNIQDGGNSITVDGTVSVSSGSVDITNTITETNSAAILADTASMDTNLGTVAGAVSGSEMQVDVVGSLPAGTNAIGKLAANSGVDIGDVTINNASGSSAVNIQDGGNVISVDDAGSTISVDDGGNNLSVDWAGTVPPIGAGAEAAALRVTIATDSTGVLSVDDNGSSLTVDGTIAVSSGSINLLANDGVDIGDVDIASVPAPLNVTGGGAEATALRVTIANDSTGVLSVDDNGGSLTVDGSVTVSSGSVDITSIQDGGNSLTVDQATHDNFNANANLQVGDADVANGNPVPVSDAGGALTVDGTVTQVGGAVASNTKVSPVGGSKIVAASGTAEPIVAASTNALSLYVRAKNANTGNIYFGDSSVDETSDQQVILSAGQSVSVDAPPGYRLDVNEFYADVDVNGEGIDFLYVG